MRQVKVTKPIPASRRARCHIAKLCSGRPGCTLSLCQVMVPPMVTVIVTLPSSGPADQDAPCHIATLCSDRPGCTLSLCHALLRPTKMHLVTLPCFLLADGKGRCHFAMLSPRRREESLTLRIALRTATSCNGTCMRSRPRYAKAGIWKIMRRASTCVVGSMLRIQLSEPTNHPVDDSRNFVCIDTPIGIVTRNDQCTIRSAAFFVR